MAHDPNGSATRATGPLGWWTATPLYARILVGMALGVAVGSIFRPAAKPLDWIAQIVLRILGALAPMLILIAVVQAIMTAEIRGRVALRIAGLLLVNTTVAILVGLGVANVVRPGAGAQIHRPAHAPPLHSDLVSQLIENIPDSLVKPFVDNRVLGVVLIALALGIACRRLATEQRRFAEQLVNLGFATILEILSWVIVLVPFAVLGKVASIVGTSGFSPFVALGKFVVAVLLALLLQTVYYLVRIRAGSWVRPLALLRGTRDALVMAFSTAAPP